MKGWLKQDWVVPVLVILLLAGIGYGFLLTPGEILYSPHSDIIAQGLGGKTVLHKALREGRGIPFWREDQLAGYPAFTNPQALYTYPLHFLFYLLEPGNAVGGTVWLHFAAAALVFYLVGTVLGLGRWARLLMATAALFNFKLVMAAYAGWLPHIPGITFVPLLFAATFYLVKRPGLGGVLAVAAAGALCLHTGHLQYFYYATLFLTFYVLWQAVGWWRQKQWQTFRHVFGNLLCGAILASGMVTYLVLPLAAEAPLISRSEMTYSFFLADHGLAPRHLLTFLHPEALGSPLDGSYPGVTLWEDVGYFGLLQLILAILGAVLGWHRNSYTRFFVASFVLSIIAAMDSPFLRLLYNTLPGFKLFRCPSRFLFLTAFFGIILAGIGLEEIISRLRKRHRGPLLAPIFTGLLLLVMSAEGIFYVRRYLATVPYQEVMPKTAYQDFFASDKTTFRIATLYSSTINYGWAASMNLQMISGYDPFNFKDYQAYFDLLQLGTVRPKEARMGMGNELRQISHGDLLDALNVKYLVSPAPLAASGGRLVLAGHWKDQPTFVFFSGMRRSDIYVYRNNYFLPRAFWVNELVEVEDEKEMVDLMKQKQLGRTAIIMGTKGRFHSCKGSAGDRVKVLEAHGGYLAVQPQNLTPRFLTIGEIWHPGWRAVIDGAELPLHRTDLALMGAWIPPGKHKLELDFRPLYWRESLVITAVSDAVFLVLFSLLFWKRRQATS